MNEGTVSQSTLLSGLLVWMAFVSGTCAAAEVDFRRYGGRGLQDVVLLAINEPVQKEIEVTAAQKEQLQRMLTEYGTFRSPIMPKIRTPDSSEPPQTPEEWETYNNDMVKAYEKTRDHFRPQLEQTLTTPQFARLEEIRVQCRGVAGLTDSETARKLALTDKQLQTLSAVHQEHIRRLQDLFAEKESRPPEERHADAIEIEKSRDADALIVLTDEQRVTFERLKGKPFNCGLIRNGPFVYGVFGPRRAKAPG